MTDFRERLAAGPWVAAEDAALRLAGPAGAFARWRTVAGHCDTTGAWVRDDPPGQRTGPPGRFHFRPDLDAARTACGKRPPPDAELMLSADAPLAQMCRTCFISVTEPYAR